MPFSLLTFSHSSTREEAILAAFVMAVRLSVIKKSSIAPTRSGPHI